MDSERVQSVQPLRSMRIERVQNVQPLRSVQVVKTLGRLGHDCATVRSLTAAGATFRRDARHLKKWPRRLQEIEKCLSVELAGRQTTKCRTPNKNQGENLCNS